MIDPPPAAPSGAAGGWARPTTAVADDGRRVSCWHAEAGDLLAPGLRAWSLLGAGKRYESWLAWSDELHHPVVVKIARPARAGEASVRAVLAREASLHRRLAHPAVQRMLWACVDAQVPYVVLEFVDGVPLDRALVDEGPFDEVDAARLGVLLASALRALHGRGYAHLDVKPGNVVLRDGRPVLLDLGITRPLGMRRPSGETRGSPPYAAPEQWRDRPCTPAMDAFSLGAALFELASGEQAFRPVKIDGHWSCPQLSSPAPGLRSAWPDAPGPLAEVVDGLLALDPAARLGLDEAERRLHAFLVEAGEPVWPDFVRR